MISKHFFIQTLRREIQSTELRIVALTICLTTLFLFMVTTALNSLSNQLKAQTEQLLGGKLVIESHEPFTNSIQQLIIQKNLQYVNNIGLFSMASYQDQFLLTQIEAFEQPFPLAGDLQYLQSNRQTRGKTNNIQRSEIWVTQSFLDKLGINLEDTVFIADKPFRITGMIEKYPLMLSQASMFSPIVYMNYQDLLSLQLAKPGSRINYRYILNGQAEDINQFQNNSQIQNAASKILSIQRGQRILTQPIKIISRYFNLILIIQTLLASLVIGFCVLQYAKRQIHTVAILRTLGARFSTIIGSHLFSLITLTVFLILISMTVGYILLAIIFALVQPFDIKTITFDWGAFRFTISIIFTMTLGFSIPSILSLYQISPKQMRFKRQGLIHQYQWIYLLAFALIMFFICLDSDNILTPLKLMGQFIIIGVIGYGVGVVLWWGLGRVKKLGSHVFRFSINTLIQHQWSGITQWTVYCFLFTLFVFIEIVQHDLLKTWRNQLPDNTPNYFLVNIQPVDVQSLHNWFKKNQLESIQLYPVVRGRFTHVNDKPVSTWEQGKTDPNAVAGLLRPINLTWMSEIPSDNKVIAGQDWSTLDQEQIVISIEERFAKSRGLTVGDKLTFLIQGESLTGKIIQVRSLSWETFKPNFYVIFPQKALETFSYALIGSFHLPPEHKKLIGDFSQEFSQISIIDIDDILQQVRDIVRKVTFVLEGILSFILLTGILLMVIMMKSTLKERVHESALLKCFGAPEGFLKKSIIIEYCIMGGLGGVFAAVFAQMILQDIAYNLFNIYYTIGIKWILISAFTGSGLLVVLGLLGFKKVLSASPMLILRKAN